MKKNLKQTMKPLMKPSLLLMVTTLAACSNLSDNNVSTLDNQQSAYSNNIIPSMAVEPVGPELHFEADKSYKVVLRDKPIFEEQATDIQRFKRAVDEKNKVFNNKARAKKFRVKKIKPRIKKASEILTKYGNEKNKKAVRKAAEVIKEIPKEVVTRPISTIRKDTNVISNEIVGIKKSVNSVAANAKSASTKVITSAKDSGKSKEKIVKKSSKTVANSKVKPAKSKTKSASKALLQEARDAVQSKNFDKAANALERAHRIQPKNAKILYDIAQIRYAQGKYSQASSFASKATSASKSSALSKKAWLILSKARKAQGNSIGAKTAAKKAASY